MNPGAFHPCAVAGWGFTVYWEDGRFLCIFIQSFFVEVWTLQVFVPSGRPSLEATLTPMVPPARETSQMESSMAGTVGGCTAALCSPISGSL